MHPLYTLFTALCRLCASLTGQDRLAQALLAPASYLVSIGPGRVVMDPTGRNTALAESRMADP